MTHFRRAYLIIAVGTLGLLAGVALVEVTLRLLDISPVQKEAFIYVDVTNPITGWAHKPNAVFVSDGGREFQVPVRINARGLRDREYTYPKPQGSSRLLVLGDSFTAALEVPLEHAWHEVLEGMLRSAAPRPVEIISAGVGAWGTDQQLLYFRHEGHKYQPDLVVLQFFYNDIQDNDTDLVDPALKDEKPFFTLRDRSLELQNFPFKGPGRGSRLGRLRTYRLWGTVRRTLQKSAQRQDVETRCGTSDRLPRRLLGYSKDVPSDYVRAWELTRLLIRELRGEVARYGGRLAVVYFPDRRQVIPGVWETTIECFPAAARVEWDLDQPNRTLGQLLSEDAIPYLDLTDSFRRAARANGEGLYFTKNRHFQSAGHRLAASLIATWVTRERLVP